MTGIIDYGVGNIFSIQRSLEKIGEKGTLVADPERLMDYDRILLPGVGAFGDAIKKLRAAGMEEAIKEEVKKGKTLLGICLGMQLLLSESREYGAHKGMDLISGSVLPIKDYITDLKLKVPHMGWNALSLTGVGQNTPLFKYIKEGDYVYFVHSYSCMECDEAVLAYSDYSYPIAAAIGKDNVLGLQFHPEKSGQVGLSILKAFCEM